MIFYNVNDATVGLLRKLNRDGHIITVRGMETCELLNCNFTVENAAQRCVLLEERNANIFAQIAETLWMLAGRNDLDWLERYIPSCKKWSDDGYTWRAAYGPRLRGWHRFVDKNGARQSIDQIEKIVHKLRDDPYTRQAVISLWDPARDWVEGSKDYPCNNWLHFVIRDNKLHMNVSVRSNDVIFGFSHCDFFGWSVLLQLMAYWVGAEPGSIHWNATSMHIYDRHYDKANKIASSYDDYIVYPDVLPVETQFEQFDVNLSGAFWVEELSVKRPDLVKPYHNHYTSTDLLSVMTYLLCVYNVYLANPQDDSVLLLVDSLLDCDLKVAASQFLSHKFTAKHMETV